MKNNNFTDQDLLSPSPEKIRYARKRYGVDRARAAYMIGVTETDWSNWESGLLAMPQGYWNVFMLKTMQGEHAHLRDPLNESF